MRTKIPLFTFLFVFLCISSCFGSEPGNTAEKDIAIHTYGGGIFLRAVFNVVAMIIYDQTSGSITGAFNSILRIALTIGGFGCICTAFFNGKFDPIIKNFFLPGVAIMSCVLVPRTTVYIQDHITNETMHVQNVPYFLGISASLMSTISYQLTQSIEDVTHPNNDMLYNWVGHIYADDHFFQAKKCRLTNPLLENNFREFCRECVFRDLGLGNYSRKQLLDTTNILEFLEKNTSNIRTIYYRESPETLEANSTAKNSDSTIKSFISCKEAMKKMNALFNGQQGDTKKIVFSEIGSDFHLLLNQSTTGTGDLKSLLKQQIAINVLKEEIPGTLGSFAARRAEILTRENQKIYGYLGAKMLVHLRTYVEALLYLVFPLVIILSLASFGLKVLISWIQLVVWINTWPPCYVLVKFLLQSTWVHKIKDYKTQDSTAINLTVFSYDGLSDIYYSLEPIAAAAMALIPVISLMLLKGGIHQMVQFASSVMAPAQSAAGITASEQVYGNYNLGNVNLSNVNGYNAQTFRQTYSGLLTTGSVGIDSGTETMTYMPNQDSLYVKQSDSYLREGISRTQSFSSAVQNSLATSQTALQENSKTFSENLSDSSNKAVGLVQALSNQFQKGESFNTQTTSGLQEAVQYMQGIGSDYAHSNGTNRDQGLREAISAGMGVSLGVKGSVDASYQDGVSTSESDNSSQKAFDSESFQRHLQTLVNASSGEIGSILKGEDARLHNDFVKSFNETQSSSDQWRAAYSEHEALSNLKSYSESDQVAIHQNLNQRFVDFLQEKYHDGGKINSILEMPSEMAEKDALIREFVDHLLPNDPNVVQGININTTYTDHLKQAPTVSSQTYDDKASNFIHQGELELGHSFGEMEQRIEAFKSQIHQAHNINNGTLQDANIQTDQKYNLRKSATDTSLEKSIGTHFLEEASSLGPARFIINKFTNESSNPTRAVYHDLYGHADPVQSTEN